MICSDMRVPEEDGLQSSLSGGERSDSNAASPVPSPTSEDLSDDSQSQEIEPTCLWLNCRARFESAESLAAHLSCTHLPKSSDKDACVCRWENCARGSKSFSTRVKLVSHMRSHTGERPYACPSASCSKRFSRLDILNKHIKCHEASKDFICTVYGCGQCFNDLNSLRSHLQVHLISRPFACTVPGCTKRYTDMSGLHRHSETHRELFANKPAAAKQTLDKLAQSILRKSSKPSLTVDVNGLLALPLLATQKSAKRSSESFQEHFDSPKKTCFNMDVFATVSPAVVPPDGAAKPAFSQCCWHSSQMFA